MPDDEMVTCSDCGEVKYPDEICDECDTCVDCCTCRND